MKKGAVRPDQIAPPHVGEETGNKDSLIDRKAGSMKPALPGFEFAPARDSADLDLSQRPTMQ